MNKITPAVFHKIYYIFGLMFGLLTLSIVIFALHIKNITKLTFTTIILIYALCIILLLLLFIFQLKSKLTIVFKSLDNIIDNAINGNENTYTCFQETSISALENKMYRFVTMSKSTTNIITEERNKIKSLISNISHQTKTPIANILLYSELLLDNHTLDEKEKELAKGIKSQSEKLKWLIQSLIKMSRLEVGIISVNKTLTSVFQTISNSISTVFSSAEKKGIKIQVFCSESIKTYHDCKWTSEALMNVLSNAIKYTPSGGKIDISVKPYEMFTRINISDTGIGINETEINNIFKRFYRCNSVSQYEGIGIGLYLTREIITSQGGYIKVKSKLNKGSTFSVFLPNTKAH